MPTNQNGKNRKYRRVHGRERDQPDQEVLDSIGSPNIWTPEIENAWLEELRKIPAKEIYRRFPPIKKPGNVARRGKTCGN